MSPIDRSRPPPEYKVDAVDRWSGLEITSLGIDILGFTEILRPVARPRASEDVYHAIAERNRRVLIDLMEPGPRAVGELVAASGMSYSATSQHLAILRRAGLVSSHSSGRRRLYQLHPAVLREVHDWSARYSAFWRSRLDALGELLQEEQ
jgi:DNA-binding transcriptional ArsR family regulator